MIKQRQVPALGEVVDSLFSCLPFLSFINFIFISIVVYADIHPYLKVYAPWVQMWMFLLFLSVVTVLLMFFVYKFVLPSLWVFRGKQLFGFESEVLDKLNKIEKLCKKDTQERTGVVVVSGGFDPLNGIGHLSHIREAKKLGDKLVVILSRDDQLVAKGNKPNGTFYPSIEDRIEIIKELRSVDEVVLNIDKDGTSTESLRLVRPQIFAKGGDRTPDNMPDNEIKMCEEIGCKIVYNVGVDKTVSSSQLVRRQNG